MIEMKRYDFDGINWNDPRCSFQERLGGQYIRYDEYAKLTAELAAERAKVERLEAERDAAFKLLDDSKPNPNTLAWYATKRPLFHATYNGGHRTDETREAFHHGMDTVFNALEGDAKKMIELAKVDALEVTK